MTPETWRRMRQAVQILVIIAFFYLFISTDSLSDQKENWDNLFFRLDPLVALTAMLAGRVFIAGLALAVLTVIVTFVFGKVWCGWFCPLGTLLEWFPLPSKKLPNRVDAKHINKPPENWRSIKVFILLILIFSAFLGNQSLIFLDPLSLLTRTLSGAVWPALNYGIAQSEAFLYQFDFLWDGLDLVHNMLVYPLFQDMVSVFVSAMPTMLLFVAIMGLNRFAERFWCRYLCPLGALLGWVSRIALLRRQVGQKCNDCGLCGQVCPTGTINSNHGFQSDPAECTVCMDCLVVCKQKGVSFQWQVPGFKPAAAQDYDLSRRQVLQTMGLAVAGVALAGVEPITRQQPAFLIRPPGAGTSVETEASFEMLCIRCGECVRACPTQGLQAALFEGGWVNIFTPMLVPRLGYCSFNCVACGEMCPSGAIPLLTLKRKQQTPIGLARVDRDRCLPWAYSIPCIICEEVCPLAPKAIQLEELFTESPTGEQLIIQRPMVIKEVCIGCGICEYQCPMGGEAAICVFSPTYVNVQGESVING